MTPKQPSIVEEICHDACHFCKKKEQSQIVRRQNILQSSRRTKYRTCKNANNLFQKEITQEQGSLI
jgi:hypothetical protein